MADSGNISNKVIWGVTALAVLLILGLSVAISQKKGEGDPAQEAVSPVEPVVGTAPDISYPDTDVSAEPVPEDIAAMDVDSDGRDGLGLLLDNLAGTLVLSSPHRRLYEPGVRYPADFTCFRHNKSPPLRWKGAPPGTESFAVFFERRVPDEEPFVSWLLFNIDGDETALREDVPKVARVPDSSAIHARSDLNNLGYGGPCESRGVHNYVFRIFALDKKLDLPPGASRMAVISAMNGHIVDAAEFPVEHHYR